MKINRTDKIITETKTRTPEETEKFPLDKVE